jgi:hypothetical protein
MEVFTYGNIEYLTEIFNAVRQIMGTSEFSTLIRISLLLGFLVLFYSVFFSMRADIIALGVVRNYIAVVAIFYALFVPKTDIVIRDEVKNTQQSVNSVPLGLALGAHFFTTAEKGITNLFETYFALPDDLKFSGAGYSFSVMVMDNLKYAVPLDPYFKRTLDGFILDCFYTDVLWGDKSLNAIIFSNDLWAQMTPAAHSQSHRALIYDDTDPQGRQDTCANVYTYLTSNFNAAAATALTDFRKSMQTAPDDATFASQLDSAAGYLINVSVGAVDLVRQAIVVNSVKDSMAKAAMYSGVDADALLYATSLAQIQQRNAWSVGGELSKKYIPIIRQILEAFVYGLFPVLFLMMMTPLWGKALRMYFSLLIWLLMWSPLYAILNLIINTRARAVLDPIQGQFSMGRMPYLFDSSADLTAMAGYIAWLVPTIAFAVAKGSDYALTSLAGSISSSTNLTQHHSGAAITGTHGAERTAHAAGIMQAAATYGSYGAMSGVVANKFMNMSGGYHRAGTGLGTMDRVARGGAMADTGARLGEIQMAQAFGFGANLDKFYSWQRTGSQLDEVAPALEAGGFLSPGTINRFSMGGMGISNPVVDSDGRLTSFTASSNDGTRSLAFRDGKIIEKGVTRDDNVSALRQEMAAAGLTNAATALTPGMSYENAHDARTGRHVETALSQGGRVIVNDKVSQDGTISGSQTLDSLRLDLGNGQSLQLQAASVAWQGSRYSIRGQHEGALYTATGVSNRGLAVEEDGRDSIAFEKGPMTWSMEKEGTVSMVMTTDEARRLANDARDPHAAARLNELAHRSKDGLVRMEGSASSNSVGLSPESFATLKASVGTEVSRKDTGESITGIKEDRTYNKKELEDLEKQLRSRGHYGSADMLNTVRHKMGDDESSRVKLLKDSQGNLATVLAEHGSQIYHYDKGAGDYGISTTKGIQNIDNSYKASNLLDKGGKAYSVEGIRLDYGSGYSKVVGLFTDKQSGAQSAGAAELEDGNLVFLSTKSGQDLTNVDRTKDVYDHQNEYKDGITLSSGTVIDDKTAFQMALREEDMLVRPVTNPYLTEKTKDGEIAALSSALGRGAGDFLRREGVSLDYTRVAGEGHIGYGTPSLSPLKAGIQGKGEIGGMREDKKTTPLITQQYELLIRDTLKEAQDKGLTVKETRELLSSRIGNYSDALYREARANDEDKFGGDSLKGMAKEAFDKFKDHSTDDPKPYRANPLF